MLTLHSSSFAEGQEIPQKHGKRAENVSPQLSWHDAPAETRSFAVALVDTHPVARGYVHWLVVNIGGDTTILEEGAATGAMPPGSHEVVPYAGPFPPAGTHDYEFTLYALSAERVDAPQRADLRHFLEAVEPHALATAKLVGRFTKR